MTAAEEPADETHVQRLVAEVQRAAKARYVMPEFVTRLCVEELVRRPASDREMVKRVKRSLHQVGGAYLAATPRYDRELARLAAVPPGPARFEELRRALDGHASMRERSSRLDDYYAALFDGLDGLDGVRPGDGPQSADDARSSDGPPAADRSRIAGAGGRGVEVVLDLACGLNPLGRPAMPISPRRYVACDIYLDLLDFVSAAADALGYPVETFPHDLLAGPPVDIDADVVLLLKTLPCLEQLDRDAARRLLAAIRAPHVIVTYPVTSLGGADKGMRASYTERFHAVAEPLGREITALDLPFELGFRLSRAEATGRRSTAH